MTDSTVATAQNHCPLLSSRSTASTGNAVLRTRRIAYGNRPNRRIAKREEPERMAAGRGEDPQSQLCWKHRNSTREIRHGSGRRFADASTM